MQFLIIQTSYPIFHRNKYQVYCLVAFTEIYSIVRPNCSSEKVNNQTKTRQRDLENRYYSVIVMVLACGLQGLVEEFLLMLYAQNFMLNHAMA